MEGKEKMKRGWISISLNDEIEDKWNQSLSLTKDLYYKEEDEVLEIEQFYDLCISFLRAYGYSENAIKEYFDIW